MSRLIDENEFYKRVLEGRKFVWQVHDFPRNEIVIQTVYEDLAEFVRNIPTAYDVEAVVRELEEKSKLYSLSDRDCEFAIPLNIAIEIVKRGGRNE